MKYVIPGTDITFGIIPDYTLDEVTQTILKCVVYVNQTSSSHCPCCSHSSELYDEVCRLITPDQQDNFRAFVELDAWRDSTPDELEAEGYEGYVGQIQVLYEDTGDKRVIYTTRDSYYSVLTGKRRVCEIMS